MYPISNQQIFFLKKIIIIYQTNKEKQTNENKLIGRIIKMDRHVCSGFDLQRKRKRGGEMDNQQIESFQIKQRCKVNRESHTSSSSSRN